VFVFALIIIIVAQASAIHPSAGCDHPSFDWSPASILRVTTFGLSQSLTRFDPRIGDATTFPHLPAPSCLRNSLIHPGPSRFRIKDFIISSSVNLQRNPAPSFTSSPRTAIVALDNHSRMPDF
jgi:hypothetical protein